MEPLTNPDTLRRPRKVGTLQERLAIGTVAIFAVARKGKMPVRLIAAAAELRGRRAAGIATTATTATTVRIATAAVTIGGTRTIGRRI
jgi:hypothetical protein